MSKNEEMFMLVKSISNTVDTVNELDDLIKSDGAEPRTIELKKRREQLIDVLAKMAKDLELKANHIKNAV